METFERFVSLVERLAKVYREVIIFVLLLVLFGQPLIEIWSSFNG